MTNQTNEELREVFGNIATYNELVFHEKDRACPICGIKPLTMSNIVFNCTNKSWKDGYNKGWKARKEITGNQKETDKSLVSGLLHSTEVEKESSSDINIIAQSIGISDIGYAPDDIPNDGSKNWVVINGRVFMIHIENICGLIQSHTNKAISDVLDNLEKKQDELFPCDCQFNMGFAYKKGQTCSGKCATAGWRNRAIDAIQQERNKLKEVSNE